MTVVPQPRPDSSTGDEVARQRLAAARTAVDSAPDPAAISMLADLRALEIFARLVADRVEEVTGLRHRQIAVLQGVAEGVDPEAVARLAGMDDVATRACVAGLVRAGLLRTVGAGAGPTPVELTESGWARVSQCEGLQVRVVDVVLRAVGDETSSNLSQLLGELVRSLDVMTSVTVSTAAAPRNGDW